MPGTHLQNVSAGRNEAETHEAQRTSDMPALLAQLYDASLARRITYLSFPALFEGRELHRRTDS